MPVITVEWLSGRGEPERRRLTEAITKAFIEVARVPREQVWIVFRDVPRTHWAIGGQLMEPGASAPPAAA